MYTITKEFHFSASHQLDHLPPTHQCARLHGHNYIVKVELSSEKLDANGFVIDYGELYPLKNYIDNHLDHRHLNEVLGGALATTAEALAFHLFEFCDEQGWPVSAVHVSETPKTWATYSRPLLTYRVSQTQSISSSAVVSGVTQHVS